MDSLLIQFIIISVHFQALADPYFLGLANVDREPSTQPISKLEFEFERKKLTKDDVRELIYREVRHQMLIYLYCFSLPRDCSMFNMYLVSFGSKQILEYHPLMLQEYLQGGEQTSFMYPRCGFNQIFLKDFVEHVLTDVNSFVFCTFQPFKLL